MSCRLAADRIYRMPTQNASERVIECDLVLVRLTELLPEKG
jgi:hypothetical protein